MIRAHVLICGGTGCTSSGSLSIQKAFEENIAANGLSEEVKLVQTGCFGLCALGPVVIVYPDGTFYSRVTADDVKEIVEEHLLKGRPVERLVYSDTGAEEKVEGAIVALNDTAITSSAALAPIKERPKSNILPALTTNTEEKLAHTKITSKVCR